MQVGSPFMHRGVKRYIASRAGGRLAREQGRRESRCSIGREKR